MTAPAKFPNTSRYSGIETGALASSDGRTIPYLRRRFVPAPERFALLQEHSIVEGERLDNLTAHYLGDPEQFWRLCDANGAVRPDEITDTIGKSIHITLPEGIPAPTS